MSDTNGKPEPLLPKWLEAKKQSAALTKNGAFRPDIIPVIRKLDQLATDYENWKKQKEKLPELLTALTSHMDKMGEAEGKLDDQRTKVKEEDDAKFTECSQKLDEHKGNPEADPAEVIANLDAYVRVGNDYNTMTKTLNDQISKSSAQILEALRKGRDVYKAKVDAINAGLKKVETDGKATQAQIRAIGLSYEKIAVGLKDMDTVKVIRGFLANV